MHKYYYKKIETCAKNGDKNSACRVQIIDRCAAVNTRNYCTVNPAL